MLFSSAGLCLFFAFNSHWGAWSQATPCSLPRRRSWGFVMRGTGTCDELLRTSAWEAIQCVVPENIHPPPTEGPFCFRPPPPGISVTFQPGWVPSRKNIKCVKTRLEIFLPNFGHVKGPVSLVARFFREKSGWSKLWKRDYISKTKTRKTWRRYLSFVLML